MASRSNITATNRGGMRTGTKLLSGALSVAPVKMICGPAYDGTLLEGPRSDASEKAKTARINRILKGKE